MGAFFADPSIPSAVFDAILWREGIRAANPTNYHLVPKSPAPRFGWAVNSPALAIRIPTRHVSF
jgi:hypothetical protein